MARLTEQEKEELRRLAKSTQLRDDMRRVATSRHNPFMKDGRVDIEAWLEFLNEYNAFIGHTPKPFKPMIDRIMKL